MMTVSKTTYDERRPVSRPSVYTTCPTPFKRLTDNRQNILMVPSNILQRTLYIAHGAQSGTGFTIDIDGRQYIVTAQHVVERLSSNSSIKVMHKGTWSDVEIGDVWRSPTGADIALLSPKIALSPPLPLKVSNGKDFFLSQQIYFLGFPFGLRMEAGLVNNDYPIPFVKTGIIANFSVMQPGSQLIYCDGHNNPGFSGGPIVTVSTTNEVTAIAVVSGYRFNEDHILLNGKNTGLTYQANTGLVIGYGLGEILARIASAPTGAKLS